jgi:hypothetical protein
MWDDDQDGTDEDYAAQSALVEEVRRRSHHLLRSTDTTIPVNYGSGTQRRARVDIVDIKFEEQQGLWIDVFLAGDGDRRAYTEHNSGDPIFINRKLVTEIVLPLLRNAMILDDLIHEVDGGSSGAAEAGSSGGA